MPATVSTVTYDPNGLFGGDFPVRAAAVTIASSAALTAGAVLGRITASGKYILAAAAAEDGSAAPAAILAEDANAAAGDVSALVYFSGDFLAEKLSFGAGHTAATVETALRAAHAPIFISNRTPL